MRIHYFHISINTNIMNAMIAIVSFSVNNATQNKNNVDIAYIQKNNSFLLIFKNFLIIVY